MSHNKRSMPFHGFANRRGTAISIVLVSIVLANLVASASAAAPPGYRRMDTWQQTLLASREAMARASRAADGVPAMKPFRSQIVRGGEPARRISVHIAGQKELYLMVTGAPEVVYGAATWADAKLVAPDGRETLVCHMKSLEILDGQHDIDCNLKSGVSGPLRIAGRQFAHGLHVYASSKVRIVLDRPYERLDAWIGIDDWVGAHGAVELTVTDARGAAQYDMWQQLALDFSEVWRSWARERVVSVAP